MGEDGLSKAERHRKAANKYAETTRQADKRVQLAKSPRLGKANPKADTPIEPIDPERLSQAIRYLKEHPNR
jgi:hypothetical protein